MKNICAGTTGRDCLLAGGAIVVGVGMIASIAAWGPGLALLTATITGNSDCWSE